MDISDRLLLDRPCPFSDDYRRHWRMRRMLFADFDSGIAVDAEGLRSLTPQAIALRQADRFSCSSVLDPFCGVGGNAIAFARRGSRVTAADLNHARLAMAANNAWICQVRARVDFVCMTAIDSLDLFKADGVFLDPPWDRRGGSGGHQIDDFAIDVHPVLRKALKLFPKVAVKVPRAFDVARLARYDRTFAVSDEYLGNLFVCRTVYFGERPVK